ncbi:hypothetical protein PU560_09120 [Georgenia sp. 10Sc9-8]|uniref:Uncharacterized protein n=1 Tax=Georgenia halotolerans TaxID=3028317 RepID=A0ABT5TXE8_9MICO|nr:hypothetical protein [Georgenia halotolerans]
MTFFKRRRPVELEADVGEGFWLTEALGMQRSITAALTAPERHGRGTSARLEFSLGLGDRVFVTWRNIIVGFVPADHAPRLRDQLAAVGKAHLLSDGRVYQHAQLWRIWAGPPLGDDPTPPPPEDGEIEPPPPSLLGIPLPHRGTAGPKGRRAVGGVATARARPARRWILAVDTQSWEVREGSDLDLGLLRRRLADIAPGSTVHFRLWEQTISVTPHTRVTLTDPDTGTVEVLHEG